MFWRKNKVPWYRAPDYNGILTELDKRELDSFRYQAAHHDIGHPAASFSDLPVEVQNYIAKLEIQLYDRIQESLVARCFLISAIGAFLLLHYLDLIAPTYDSTGTLVFGMVLLVAPWLYCRFKWSRNVAQHWRDADENIRTEWELTYIAGKRKR